MKCKNLGYAVFDGIGLIEMRYIMTKMDRNLEVRYWVVVREN